MQSFSDSEEFVIDKALAAVAALCGLGLFGKPAMVRLVEDVAPLLAHPSAWIRCAAISVVSAVASQVGLADVFCFVLPVVRPMLLYDITSVTEQTLSAALRPPLFSSALRGEKHPR